MQKGRKRFCAVLLTCLMVFGVAVNTSAAELQTETANASDDGIAPCFVAIWECARGLTLENAWGELSICACTDTYPGYTSGTKVVLQKKEGSSWSFVASWEDADGEIDSTISETYYVSRGTYRLECTHTAYTTSGSVVETFVAYSDEVTY